jgi:ABC-2 type transport system permease protein
VTALYRLLLSTQATRARLLALSGLGVVAILLGLGLRWNANADPLDDGTLLMATYGLGLFVPVTTLVFASSVLGDPQEDGTLVYLWLKPVARWRIAVAALLATLTVTLPVVVVPMVVSAAIVGAGPDLVVGTVVACLLSTVAYAGIFTWLGLRVKRALVWGLAYILIWEGFVARAGANAARLSIRASSRSLLSHLAHGPERIIDVSPTTALVVPAIAFAFALVLTIRRLTTQDVA